MEMENPEPRWGASVAVWILRWSPHRDEDLEWTAGNAAQIPFVLKIPDVPMFNIGTFETPLSEQICLRGMSNPHPATQCKGQTVLRNTRKFLSELSIPSHGLTGRTIPAKSSGTVSFPKISSRRQGPELRQHMGYRKALLLATP
jgi:hypothetical protein